MRKIIIAVLVLASFVSACHKSDPGNTCSYDPCAVQANAGETTQLEAYLASAGITNATKHCNGMYYQVISSGADRTPTVCSYISVNYKGMLTNGNIFDQTTTTPASFTLIYLIEGWKAGIPLIKKGGKIRLYIPPSLGYGAVDRKDATGATVIPANSILIFDIELVEVQ